jgi:hypothetical protein
VNVPRPGPKLMSAPASSAAFLQHITITLRCVSKAGRPEGGGVGGGRRRDDDDDDGDASVMEEHHHHVDDERADHASDFSISARGPCVLGCGRGMEPECGCAACKNSAVFVKKMSGG